MGMDLAPKRRDAGGFHLGGFSWGWMMQSGVGLPIGCSGERWGVGYIYVPRKVRGGHAAPIDNSGFPVTAREARAMALAARGLVVAERYRHEQWNALSDEERKRIEDLPYRDPERERVPVREDFIEKAERFAAWAEKSGGFRIF